MRRVIGRLNVACNRTTNRRLPPVLLYIQVMTTLKAMVATTNRGKRLRGRPACPVKYSGRW